MTAIAVTLMPSPSTADQTCCGSVTGTPLTPGAAEQLAVGFKALAEPMRLRLLSLVASHDGDKACVCDLIEPVGLSQSTVSHHLKVLVDAGLLTREKRGVWSYYRLVPDALNSLAGALSTRNA